MKVHRRLYRSDRSACGRLGVQFESVADPPSSVCKSCLRAAEAAASAGLLPLAGFGAAVSEAAE